MDLPLELFSQLIKVPPEITNAIEKVVWSARPSSSQLKQTGNTLRKLWPLLARERGQESEGAVHYSQIAALAEAYSAYYLPANVMKLPLLLGEMKCRGLPLPQSMRWMDLGCGPGTAIFGAWWYFKNHSSHAVKFWGLDHSRNFLNLGSRITQILGATNNIYWEQFSYQLLNQGQLPQPFLDRLEAIDPQVVSASNSLSEFGHDVTSRAQWLNALIKWMSHRAEQTRETRWLILVEPGSKAASRDLLAVRDSLRLESYDHLRILLPCLSDRACGAYAAVGDWCHEEAPFEAVDWHESLGIEAGLRKEQMLFSYLVSAVGPHRHAVVPSQWPTQGERVVSQRLKEKGLTKCFACTESGKKLRRVLDSKITDENRGFLEVKRGQVFESIEADEKGSVQRYCKSPFTAFEKP